MKIRKMHYAALFISVIASLILFVGPARAKTTDNLCLTGIVKNIDAKKNTVTVDVKSSSCPGIRKFAADNLFEMEDFIDQPIKFCINSTACKDDTIYKMLPGVEVKK